VKRNEPPKPPSTERVDLVHVRPHVEREITLRLREKNLIGYRDRRRPQPELTPTEKVQVKAALVAAKYDYIDALKYALDLAPEVAAMTQVVAAPEIDLPTTDALDALRQPEGRELWRAWRDPFSRRDKLLAVAAAKALAITMVVHGKVYVRKAYDGLKDSVETQQLYNALEAEVSDAC
jgi:hypothetical protein